MSTSTAIINLKRTKPINFDLIDYRYASSLCPRTMQLSQDDLNTYYFVKDVNDFYMYGGPMVLKGKLKEDTIKQYEQWGYKTRSLREVYESCAKTN